MVVKLLDTAVTLVAVDGRVVRALWAPSWVRAAWWLVGVARKAVLHRYQVCSIARHHPVGLIEVPVGCDVPSWQVKRLLPRHDARVSEGCLYDEPYHYDP